MDIAFYVGAAISAYGAVRQGQFEAASFRLAAFQDETQAIAAEAAAVEAETERLRELEYADQMALASAVGVDAFSSPSWLAMYRNRSQVADRDLRALRLMGQTQAVQARTSARINRASAKAAKASGWITGVGLIGQGLYMGQQVAPPSRKF